MTYGDGYIVTYTDRIACSEYFIFTFNDKTNVALLTSYIRIHSGQV